MTGQLGSPASARFARHGHPGPFGGGLVNIAQAGPKL